MGVEAPFTTIFDPSSTKDPPYQQNDCVRANAVCLSGMIINLYDRLPGIRKQKAHAPGDGCDASNTFSK